MAQKKKRKEKDTKLKVLNEVRHRSSLIKTFEDQFIYSVTENMHHDCTHKNILKRYRHTHTHRLNNCKKINYSTNYDLLSGQSSYQLDIENTSQSNQNS